MATIPVRDIFHVAHGTNFDLKQMQIASDHDDESINFVSRSSKNLGVVARVKACKSTDTLPAGLITVALGGSYLLSAFVQERPFYTAQNVAILTPRLPMTRESKLFYCLCLGKNRFKYSAFGREANRTLEAIRVPKVVPKWVPTVSLPLDDVLATPILTTPIDLYDRSWKPYQLDKLFEIKKGSRVVNNDLRAGATPFIRPTAFNNGVGRYVSLPANHRGNTITIPYNGNIGEAFYQPVSYFAVDDINVLYPRFTMTPFRALFLLPLIRMERYRYSFGRKWNLRRMRESTLRLPASADGPPDWLFIERYMKSLSFASAVEG